METAEGGNRGRAATGSGEKQQRSNTYQNADDAHSDVGNVDRPGFCVGHFIRLRRTGLADPQYSFSTLQSSNQQKK